VPAYGWHRSFGQAYCLLIPKLQSPVWGTKRRQAVLPDILLSCLQLRSARLFNACLQATVWGGRTQRSADVGGRGSDATVCQPMRGKRAPFIKTRYLSRLENRTVDSIATAVRLVQAGLPGSLRRYAPRNDVP
jgi:hypothetical protein